MTCRNSIHFLQSEVLKFSQEIEDHSLEIENLEREIYHWKNATSGYNLIEAPRIHYENLLCNTQSVHDSLRSPHVDALPVRNHLQTRVSRFAG